MALQVRNNLRTNSCKSLTNPSFIHLFSSKSNPAEPNDRDNPSTSPTTSQSSISSYFSDVKASLKQAQQPASPSKSRKFVFSSASSTSSTNSFQSKSSNASLDEIRKNLSEFRRRMSCPPPPPNDLGSAPLSSSSSSSSQNIPLQELFQRNAIKNSDDSNVSSDSLKGRPRGELSFQAIRESLQHLDSSRSKQSESKVGDSMSLLAFRRSLKLKPSDSAGASSTTVIGGTEKLPSSVFGKEMLQRSSTGSPTMNTKFVKSYGPAELGEKLRKLRSVDGGKSFSLAELNERLMKLREMEEMESESFPLKDLRESLVKISISAEEQDKQSSIQKLCIFGQLGGTPNFMQKPPKDQLVEKYFHPDNMSSTEKLKIELAKVRDDFKMSDSDCGSARVQVAQLTTKIKHLSSVLHKKDKHSRKGLLGMVQKRKKLLKYLRRTDWDSYCFVLSKLGLRDNPDYKN